MRTRPQIRPDQRQRLEPEARHHQPTPLQSPGSLSPVDVDYAQGVLNLFRPPDRIIVLSWTSWTMNLVVNIRLIRRPGPCVSGRPAARPPPMAATASPHPRPAGSWRCTIRLTISANAASARVTATGVNSALPRRLVVDRTPLGCARGRRRGDRPLAQIREGLRSALPEHSWRGHRGTHRWPLGRRDHRPLRRPATRPAMPAGRTPPDPYGAHGCAGRCEPRAVRADR
jgi:hypothetical protein